MTLRPMARRGVFAAHHRRRGPPGAPRRRAGDALRRGRPRLGVGRPDGAERPAARLRVRRHHLARGGQRGLIIITRTSHCESITVSGAGYNDNRSARPPPGWTRWSSARSAGSTRCWPSRSTAAASTPRSPGARGLVGLHRAVLTLSLCTLYYYYSIGRPSTSYQIFYTLTCSVPLFLKRQCDRTLRRTGAVESMVPGEFK